MSRSQEQREQQERNFIEFCMGELDVEIEHMEEFIEDHYQNDANLRENYFNFGAFVNEKVNEGKLQKLCSSCVCEATLNKGDKVEIVKKKDCEMWHND